MAQPYPSFTPTYHHDQYPAIDPAQFNCSNHTVLITGGGRGIGRAIALAFATARARAIALVGRTQSTLDDTAAAIRTVSPSTAVHTATLDLAGPPTAIDTTLRGLVDTHFGGRAPDILVQNAGGRGVATGGDVADHDLDEWWTTMELNVRGPLAVCAAFVRAAAAAGGGDEDDAQIPRTIINVSSGAAVLPYAPGASAYAVSKLAMAKAVEYVHHERPAWRVFNLQPGVVDTDLARAAGRKAPDSPRLPAGTAVWMAMSPRAEVLSGRFWWANWDVEEMLAREEEVRKKGWLRLGLKGWAENLDPEEMVRNARAVHQNAHRKE